MSLENVDRPLTLIAFLPDDLHKKVNHEEIVAKLLAKTRVDDVQCIQFMPNGYVRLTYSSMEARGDAFLNGVFYDSVRLRVFEAQPTTFNVYVHHLPFEVPDRSLEEVLSGYGVVHSIAEQTYPGSPIYNGSRVVKMTVTTAIPANLRVLRFPCRVYYKDQPMSCYICKKSHRASNCPLRDVCRRCHQPGHFAKDCTDDPVPAASPPASATPDVPESAPAAPPPAPAAPLPAPAAPPPAPAAPPPAPPVDPVAPSDPEVNPSPEPAGSDGSDVDPDYVPPADVDLSCASSSGEMSEDPVSDDESPSVSPSQPSSADSVPSTPAPLPARPRRRKLKPRVDVTAVRSRKSAKLSSADPPPAVPVLLPEDPVSMFPPPVVACHPPVALNPAGVSEEHYNTIPALAPYSRHVIFVQHRFQPLDESMKSFSLYEFFDFGPGIRDFLFGRSSFEEIRLDVSTSYGFSAFGLDCPPPVDLPPLPADVLPLAFPSRDTSVAPTSR